MAERKLNKVKILNVPAFIITDLCKRAVVNKAPEDAEVVRVAYDAVSNNFKVIIWSEEFPSVPEGQMIPEMPEPVIRSDVFK